MPHAKKDNKKHHKKINLRNEVMALKASAKKPMKEYEKYDMQVVDWTTFIIPNTGSSQTASFAYQLNDLLGQGLGVNDRIGIKVMNKFLSLKISLTTNVSMPTSSTQPMIRVVVLYQPDVSLVNTGGPPPVTGVLYAPNITTTLNATAYLATTNFENSVVSDPVSAIMCNRNPSSLKYYSKLFDKVFKPCTNSNTRTMEIKINKRLNAHTTYADPITTQLSNNATTEGALWLVFYRDISTVTDTTTTTILTSFTSRIYYTD